ncbi:MAG: aminoacetone oxidase family FAD-binding enzyme [Patescibacteria group bacterium]
MSEKTVWDVVVIGGGPAGMIAAGRAAERGRRVLLLEKNPTLGKKLLITGGGRCNITNNKLDVREMLAKYKESGKYLFSAFTQFGVKETIEFFNGQGLTLKEEAEGRMFPASNKARSVWDALVLYMRKGGVRIRTNAEVVGITHEKSSGQMLITLADTLEVRAQSCVIACGGISRPLTGSTGDGFRWLKRMGHTIAKNNLALVPIRLKDPWIKKLAGVALSNIKLTTYESGVKQASYKGKLLFTHVGMSGPAVLNMSRDVGELLHGGEVVIMLDVFPAFDIGALREKLKILLIDQSNKKIKNVLSSLIPSALVDPALKMTGINADTPCHSVRSEERKKLVDVLKSIPLHVSGLLGEDKAVVSSGGVMLNQVNFKTMQSRIVPQLFLAGDMLNINRQSGGYSLQICWTTGYIAGSNC